MIAALLLAAAAAQAQPAGTWSFAVSGDSRNCGDVVMPAIAAQVKSRGAAFYWHLGDLRAVYRIDEDMQRRLDLREASTDTYRELAWSDFLERQAAPFGSLPFYIGIGNHETIEPKTRAEFVVKFAGLLDTPELRTQRFIDDPRGARVRTYYHWTRSGVDFIYLDNASSEQFDDAQLAWLEALLDKLEKDPHGKTLVVGMHEALPGSLAPSHSMDQSAAGKKSGRRVYKDLLKARKAGKKIYVLASHSHFYMGGVYDSPYWRKHGGVLPGWIVGTAGAVRYPLPPRAPNQPPFADAKTRVYGWLLGTASADGSIKFEFQKLAETDVPADVAARYDPDFVHWCWTENVDATQPKG